MWSDLDDDEDVSHEEDKSEDEEDDNEVIWKLNEDVFLITIT